MRCKCGYIFTVELISQHIINCASANAGKEKEIEERLEKGKEDTERKKAQNLRKKKSRTDKMAKVSGKPKTKSLGKSMKASIKQLVEMATPNKEPVVRSGSGSGYGYGSGSYAGFQSGSGKKIILKMSLFLRMIWMLISPRRKKGWEK